MSKELIERLRNSSAFVSVSLSGTMRQLGPMFIDAADTIEAQDKRIAELEALKEPQEWTITCEPPPDGFVLVPIEPTKAMLDAACARSHFRHIASDAWKAMIGAVKTK